MALLRYLKPIIVASLLGIALVAALVLGGVASSSAASIPHAPVTADYCSTGTWGC
jgi:hypothetical protein